MNTEWAQLQQRFLRDHALTSIGVKAWCRAQGLNYQTARRYIKLRAASTPSEQKSAPKKTSSSGRDQWGRFTLGNPGNPNPPGHRFKAGNQVARTHGGYVTRFDDESLFLEAQSMSLSEELVLCRARALNCIETMKSIREDMQTVDSIEQRLELYHALASTERALDKNVVRIESLTKTLSALRLDEVTEQKIVQDTERSEAATQKLQLEAQHLSLSGKASATPIAEIVANVQSIGTPAIAPVDDALGDERE
ncbi:TPA: hypothetical protein ACX6QU_003387 [Photobacterium damselae]|uniref:hypothetical protein n=1 Tax=Photobacterium damselae TaxID=38293 RepID=UPI00370BB397